MGRAGQGGERQDRLSDSWRAFELTFVDIQAWIGLFSYSVKGSRIERKRSGP